LKRNFEKKFENHEKIPVLKQNFEKNHEKKFLDPMDLKIPEI
jgi:hypothetical protein